jgi:hypothetical protein
LIENKETWIERNFNLIYQTSFKNDSFLDLQKFCAELFSKQPEKVFNSPDFTSISENILISLIRHDKIRMSEVQVWEYALKWGIAQNPGLSTDPSSYSDDDFNALKNTLQQCVTFIKFTKFTSKEFLNKAYPYRKIIPEKLYEDLVQYFLDNPNNNSEPQVNNEIGSKNIDSKIIPNNNSEPQVNIEIGSKKIDSKIITIKHAELISKWIDRLKITNELKNLYEFKLIFRGSRDGFTVKRFHEVCNNQFRTVAIIKVKDSNEILGGYNPIEWKKGRGIFGNFGTTKDSFIFSFTNKENIKKHIISRVKYENYAIGYSRIYGPSFGGGDFVICGGDDEEDGSFSDKTSYCTKNSYEKQIRKTEEYFSVEEYEVFLVRNDN